MISKQHKQTSVNDVSECSFCKVILWVSYTGHKQTSIMCVCVVNFLKRLEQD